MDFNNTSVIRGSGTQLKMSELNMRNGLSHTPVTPKVNPQ